jgi:hypothetical protein
VWICSVLEINDVKIALHASGPIWFSFLVKLILFIFGEFWCLRKKMKKTKKKRDSQKKNHYFQDSSVEWKS